MSPLISVLDLQRPVSAACPTNGKVGRHVDLQTVQAMLNLPLNQLRNTDYRFCPDPDCPTVYYSADGLQTFAEADLRERVFQKHSQDSEVFVCYCFQYTVGAVQADGESIANEIDQGIKNHQCACDIRNPQGTCCLGNVNNLIKNIQVEQ
jgi:Zinc binding domain